MKKILVIIIFFSLHNLANAQLLTQINEALKIPDSLGWQKEIRIYKFAAISNYRSLFRLYQDDDKKWKTEFFKYYYFLNEPEKTKIENIQISAESDFDILWLKIIDSDIVNLPQWKDIEYKLKESGEIKLDRGEYELTWRKKVIMDGNSYLISIRNGDNYNKITYPNPKEYFNYYPKIDELESVNQLLNLVEKEFQLTK